MKKKDMKDLAKEINDTLNHGQKEKKDYVKLGSDPFFIRETISTGSILLDEILEGGFRRGTIVEVYGKPSTGKTMVAYQTMAEAQKKYPNETVAFINMEKAFQPEFAALCGIDLSNIIVKTPDYGEEAFDLIDAMARTEKVSVITCDTVAAMVPKADFDERNEHQSVATRARMMSGALPKAVNANKNTLIIFVNQIRENLSFGGGFGSRSVSTGGNALRFFASQRIELVRASMIKERTENWDYKNNTYDKTDTFVGHMIGVKIVKDHITGSEYKNIQIPFRYDMKGIDKITELIIFAMQKGYILKKGAWYYLGEESFHGKNALWEHLSQQNYDDLTKAVLVHATRKIDENGEIIEEVVNDETEVDEDRQDS